MWLRVGITTVLLLYVLASGASISSRDNVTEEEEPKANIPLVVSIPSKVFRANKFNANDIFVPSIFPDRSKPLTHTFQPVSPTSEKIDKTTETTVDSASTTTTTSTTTTSTTTTTTTPESTTSTTEAPETTTTPSSSTTPSHEDEKHETVFEEKTEEISTLPTTTNFPTTISSTVPPTSEETTVIPTTSEALNTSSAKPSEEVVERDYGQSLGNNQGEEINGEVSSPTDEGSQLIDLDLPVQTEEPPPDIFDDNQTTNADERVEVEERSDSETPEELDPMDESAQASEVDYAVLAPVEFITRNSDLSAAQQSEIPEHRVFDWDSDSVVENEKKPLEEAAAVDAVINNGTANDSDVRISSTFSVAVLHPLGVFDSSEKSPMAAIPKERDSFKKVDSENMTSATVLIPADVDVRNGSNSTAEGSLIVLLDDDSSIKVSTESAVDNATISVANETTVHQEAESVSTPPPKFQNGKRSRPNKKFSKPSDLESKDLEPAESSQDSPSVLDPERVEEDLHAGEISALNSDRDLGIRNEPSLLDSELEASHGDPEVANDEGEYEYVYEYIDLNSTDIPENLPEGALIINDGHPVTQSTQATPQVELLIPHSDNSSQARNVPDGARPPSFRNFGPSSAVNPEDGLLLQDSPVSAAPDTNLGAFQPLGSDRPIPVQAAHSIDEEVPPTFRPDGSSLPFIPGLPESPVYFVGLQREKIPAGDGLLAPAVNKDVLSSHGSNALLDAKTEKVPIGKGDEEQLNALYALSRALPLDDNLPFIISSEGHDNATVVLPPNLPDPFSDELLGEDKKLAPVIPSTTARPITTTEAPTTTEASTTTTEAPTTTETVVETTAFEEKQVSKSPKRGPRPGGRRRPTTTTAASSLHEETTSASIPPRRGSRPNRIGNRRKTTVSISSESTTPSSEGTTAESTEKPPGAERSRFGSRGRGRPGASPTSRPATSEESGVTTPGKDRESNTIANGSRRPITSRRNNRVSASANGTSAEKDSATRGTGSPRGRRPQSGRNGNKNAADGKAPSSAAPNENGEAGGATTTKKTSIFRPRGRGRLQPKSKTTPAVDQSGTTEQSTDETHSAAESAPSERKEESSGPKEDSPAENEQTPTLADNEGTSTETPSTENSGPPRKFPPRFRPGARAPVPHRAAEASN